MRRLPVSAAAVVLGVWLALGVAAPAAAETTTWADVATEMGAVLDDAYATYQAGDLESARDRVNDAYYGYYEAKGFEKTVMAHVSGQAATDAEYEFTLIKRTILAGGPDADVTAHIAALKELLNDQAAELDGPSGGPAALFANALIIILREGLEAILVLGAIIAYLVKSGAKEKLPVVYAAAGLAVAASVALAVLLNRVTNLAGAPQEIIEGVTVLAAMAMLIWVSSWIASKSETAAWTGYLEGSVTGRSARTLGFVAFLAVFREGAEVILLYGALLASSASGTEGMIWLGLAVGLVALVAVYLAIRLLSVRLPLKPFFMGTSILLFVMAVMFVGAGVKELAEGGLLSLHQIDLLGIYGAWQALPSAVLQVLDFLGVYAFWETLMPQVLLALITVGTITYQVRKWQIDRTGKDET